MVLLTKQAINIGHERQKQEEYLNTVLKMPRCLSQAAWQMLGHEICSVSAFYSMPFIITTSNFMACILGTWYSLYQKNIKKTNMLTFTAKKKTSVQRHYVLISMT